MNHQIYYDIPFFSHLNNDELNFLNSISEEVELTKDSILNLKNDNAFYIVKNGILEYKNLTGKNESFYFNKGSFFGEIPFTENRLKGALRSLSSSLLLKFSKENLFKLFLTSCKSIKGFLKSLDIHGLAVSESGLKYLDNNTKIYTVYSSNGKIGKSLLSSLLATGLGNHGETLILDLSFKGNSIFNNFNLKLTPPLSQKSEPQKPDLKTIINNIQPAGNNISLLNISFGSKVKVNRSIISPILFLLSDKFKYIIIDLSGDDKDLCDEVFKFTNVVFNIVKKPKQLIEAYNFFDNRLSDGQRVIYFLNSHFEKIPSEFEGALVIPEFRMKNVENIFLRLKTLINEDKVFDSLITDLIRNKTGLVIYPQFFNSVYLIGLFTYLLKNNITVDCIFSSHFGYIISAFYVISKTVDEFLDNCFKFFNEYRLNSFAEVCFPENFVFKNNKIRNYMKSVFKEMRVEDFRTQLLVNLSDIDNNNLVISTGFLKDLTSASYVINPLFESINVNNKSYHSGIPHINFKAVDLLRNDIDNMVLCGVKNGQVELESLLPFFKKVFNQFSHEDNSIAGDYALAHLFIETNEIIEKLNVKDSLGAIEKEWESEIKRIGLSF